MQNVWVIIFSALSAKFLIDVKLKNSTIFQLSWVRSEYVIASFQDDWF